MREKIKIEYPSKIADAVIQALHEMNKQSGFDFWIDLGTNDLIVSAPKSEDFLHLGLYSAKYLSNASEK